MSTRIDPDSDSFTDDSNQDVIIIEKEGKGRKHYKRNKSNVDENNNNQSGYYTADEESNSTIGSSSTLKSSRQKPSDKRSSITSHRSSTGGDRTPLKTGTYKSVVEQLSQKPDDSELTETPTALLDIDLLPHQKQGLTWMLWREEQKCAGGILADSMGLGKTVAVISLILNQISIREELDDDTYFSQKDDIKKKAKVEGLRPSFATLIVLPVSLCGQWASEIGNKVEEDYLKVILYNGSKTTRDEISIRQLSKADVVITTYGVVKSEWKIWNTARKNGKCSRTDSPLYQILWNRVVLDEGHAIKNKSTDQSKACCDLPGIKRWVLTGTPVHNRLWDLYSLIKFIRFEPFNDEKFWKLKIDSGDKRSSERLNVLSKVLLLRRTKEEIQMSMPERHDLLHMLELSEVEGLVYGVMMAASRLTVKEFLSKPKANELDDVGEDTESPKKQMRKKVKDDRKERVELIAKGRNPFGTSDASMSGLLSCLLRLRQAAVHCHLAEHGIDTSVYKDLRGTHFDPVAENIGDPTNESVGEEIMAIDLFQKSVPSTKTSRVLADINKIIEKGEKGIVISQWVTVLDMFRENLEARGITTTSITGNIAAKKRDSNIQSFKAPNGPSIMLLSLTAGGVGLNLVSANHMFMVDLHWNPQMEEQAMCRIYRYGQKKDVFIHKYIIADSIEERVKSLQENKKKLADTVLDGKVTKGMLSQKDLKFLFGIE